MINTVTNLGARLAGIFAKADCFTTRPGLWVSDNFRSRITSAYPKALVPRGLEGVESFDLPFGMFDSAIVDRMSGEENVRKYTITPDQIADLINLQPNGEAGKLLTNNNANLFYVVGAGGMLFVTFVFWEVGNRGWGVNVWGLSMNSYWPPGSRVFRNTQ